MTSQYTITYDFGPVVCENNTVLAQILMTILPVPAIDTGLPTVNTQVFFNGQAANIKDLMPINMIPTFQGSLFTWAMIDKISIAGGLFTFDTPCMGPQAATSLTLSSAAAPITVNGQTLNVNIAGNTAMGTPPPPSPAPPFPATPGPGTPTPGQGTPQNPGAGNALTETITTSIQQVQCNNGNVAINYLINIDPKPMSETGLSTETGTVSMNGVPQQIITANAFGGPTVTNTATAVMFTEGNDAPNQNGQITLMIPCEQNKAPAPGAFTIDWVAGPRTVNGATVNVNVVNVQATAQVQQGQAQQGQGQAGQGQGGQAGTPQTPAPGGQAVTPKTPAQGGAGSITSTVTSTIQQVQCLNGNVALNFLLNINPQPTGETGLSLDTGTVFMNGAQQQIVSTMALSGIPLNSGGSTITFTEKDDAPNMNGQVSLNIPCQQNTVPFPTNMFSMQWVVGPKTVDGVVTNVNTVNVAGNK